MTPHRSQCLRLAHTLRTAPAPGAALIGFDGFVDHIISVVDTRHSAQQFSRVPSISSLAQRLAAAAGRSTNLELVVERSKIGGNGPIMAAAMLAQGSAVTIAGLLGDGRIDEVFAPLRDGGARLVSMGPPAVTDALEFADGKVMLGKLTPLDRIAVPALEAAFGGRAALAQELRTHPFIATVNWTMILGMSDIWRHCARTLLPGLRSDRPRWFIDLADPAKRSLSDLRDALDAMAELQPFADVILGLNGSECRQVSACLGLAWPTGANELSAAQAACQAIRARCGVSMVMCHLTDSAACAWRDGSAISEGFLCASPRITTGAGDHFNAGFASGLLSGLSPEDALLLGGATSGCYVRDAASPGRARLCEFLASWAAGGE